MLKELQNVYNEANLLLFVGAGVSQNLGLPSWNQLIDKIAEHLDYDPDVFHAYGDYMALAEYYINEKSGLGELRSWMDKAWNRDDIKIENSEVHRLIAEGDFPLIYTTNYDNWLEKAHDFYRKDYTKIVKIGDIARRGKAKREIVKLHGDFSDDDSIVLGETSYFKRLDFNTPLDIKLRADSLGKSMLFIGYSLNDINMRYLLYKLNKLWSEYGGRYEKPKSYILTNKPNPVQKSVIKNWGIETLGGYSTDPGENLLMFLKELTGK